MSEIGRVNTPIENKDYVSGGGKLQSFNNIEITNLTLPQFLPLQLLRDDRLLSYNDGLSCLTYLSSCNFFFMCYQHHPTSILLKFLGERAACWIGWGGVKGEIIESRAVAVVIVIGRCRVLSLAGFALRSGCSSVFDG